MSGGPWEDFGPAPAAQAGPWADFGQGKPQPIGAEANADFLRREIANADPGTKFVAAFGTPLSDTWEALKQYFGKGDTEQLQANRMMEKASPAGAISGNAAMFAIPMGAIGNSVADAAKVGVAGGALTPVEGESVWTPAGVAQKLQQMTLSGVLAAGGQALANKGGQMLMDKLKELSQASAKNATRTATVNNALDAGLGLTPSEVNPTWWGNLLESFGGKTATAREQSARNAAAVPDLMREDLYLPANAPLTPATMQGARDAAYQVGYKPVTDLPWVNWDRPFLKEIDALSPASKGGAVASPAQGEIDDLVSGLRNKGNWTGEQLVYDIRNLRQQASANFRAAGMPGGNPGAQELAHAQQGAADALERLAQRNVNVQGGSPDALQLMREARQYIAQTHAAEDALIAGTDMADPRVLARMADNGRPLSGNMKTIGEAANVFPRSFQDPTRAGGADVSVINFLAGSAGGGALGEMGDHGYLGAAAGPLALALARRGARGVALSGMSQNRLRDLYRLGLADRAAAGALQYAPVAGAVLGREALSQ